MTEPVRLGIVGCGVIGRRHMAAAAASAVVAVSAVADVDPTAREHAASAFGIDRLYPDAAGLIGDDAVQAVVLALPAGVRDPIARAVLAAGKHLLIEKPAAMSAGELSQLARLRNGLVVGCCSSRFRFLPAAVTAADLIAAGELGEIRLLRCRAIDSAPPAPEQLPPPWRLSRALNGGGILANWGAYDLDYLLGITGWQLQPVGAYATSWPIAGQLAGYVPPGSDAETHLAGLVRFSGGEALSIERGEYTAEPGGACWEVVGSAGSLRLQMTPTPQPTVILDRVGPAGLKSEAISAAPGSYEQIAIWLLDDFGQAVLGGRSPSTDLSCAITVQKIIDALYASARSVAAVPIE
jgi:predicted dehydrogenase